MKLLLLPPSASTTTTRLVKKLAKVVMKLKTAMLLNQTKGIIAMFFGRTQAKELCKFKKRYECKHSIATKELAVTITLLQGCFLDNIDCYNKSRCIRQREKLRKDLLFCCCEGDYCNHEFSWEPLSNDTPRLTGKQIFILKFHLY